MPSSVTQPPRPQRKDIPVRHYPSFLKVPPAYVPPDNSTVIGRGVARQPIHREERIPVALPATGETKEPSSSKRASSSGAAEAALDGRVIEVESTVGWLNCTGSRGAQTMGGGGEHRGYGTAMQCCHPGPHIDAGCSLTERWKKIFAEESSCSVVGRTASNF